MSNDLPDEATLLSMMEAMINSQLAGGSMFDRGLDYWEKYFGGEIDDKLLPNQWPRGLADLTQPSIFIKIDADLLVKAIFGDEKARREAKSIVRARMSREDKQASWFFKIGHRTCKDVFTLTVEDPSEVIEVASESERAMEEIAVAKAKDDQVLITFRPAIDDKDLDNHEVRVYIKNGEVMAASTGPYTNHTEEEALKLWSMFKSLTGKVASLLHVDGVWVDLIMEQSGDQWLCDINPGRPTTWPGHFDDIIGSTDATTMEKEIKGLFSFLKNNPSGKPEKTYIPLPE